MRKVILIIVALALVISIIRAESTGTVTSDNSKSGNKTNKPIDIYDFPIKPGTKEWKALGTHKNIVKACQIPEDILKKMSTEGLIETCLRYPFLPDMFLSNNIQKGFESIVLTFNGLQELLRREDASTKLLAKYRQIRKLDRQSIQKEFGEFGVFYFRCFEIVISQNIILSKLSEEEKVKLLRECIWKYHERQKHPNTYGYVSKHRVKSHETLLLMGRILENEEYKPFKLKIQDKKYLRDFLDGAVWASDTDEIIPEVEKFLKNKK
ncbi:MAG: hypothetical protein AB1349_10865 [Elusimicrobiota bacterium]